MVDKLAEKYTKNIDEAEITEVSLYRNKSKHKCSSCTLYIVIFSIIFTINIAIGTYFVYSHGYLKNDGARVMLDTRTETKIYLTYE